MSKLLIGKDVVFDDLKAVIFDKDGTLIDIHHYWSSMIRIRASLIAKKWPFVQTRVEVENFLVDIMGVDLSTGKMKPDGPVGVKSREYIVDIVTNALHSSLGVDVDKEQVEDVFSEVDRETLKDISPLLKLLPGVKNLLISLKKCGVTMVIASTDLTSRTRTAMEALKIDHFFSEIFGGDSVKRTKPLPDLVIKTIKKCNIAPDKIVVIGSFFFLSILKCRISLGSNSKSNQDPLPGIILQLNKSLPLACVLPLSWSKNTPGLLCIWFTTTL